MSQTVATKAKKATDAKKRTFKLYTYDKNDWALTGVTTCRTKPLTDDELKKCIQKELLSPFYRGHTIWEIVR